MEKFPSPPGELLEALRLALATSPRSHLLALSSSASTTLDASTARFLSDLDSAATRVHTSLSPALQGLPEHLSATARELSLRAGLPPSLLSLSYLSRLLTAIALLLAAGFLNALTSTAVGWHTPNVIFLDVDGNPDPTRTSLPDLGHALTFHLIARLSDTPPDAVIHALDRLRINDAILLASAAAVLALLYFHPRKLTILRRVALVLAILQATRAVTVALTLLVDPSPHCIAEFSDSDGGAYKRLPIWPGAWDRTIQRIFITPGWPEECGDIVFSGHVSNMVLCAMVFWTYCRPGRAKRGGWVKRCALARFLMVLVAVAGCVTVIATRFHYTLDTFLGVLLTYEAWTRYHGYASVAALRRKDFFLQWMESDEIRQAEHDAYEELVELLDAAHEKEKKLEERREAEKEQAEELKKDK